MYEQVEDLSQIKYPKQAYYVNTDLHFNLLCEVKMKSVPFLKYDVVREQISQ